MALPFFSMITALTASIIISVNYRGVGETIGKKPHLTKL
jgi:hypothetical protein